MSWLWQTVLRWTLGCMCLFQIWFPWCITALLICYVHVGAKLLQLCPILCDPMDYSPPGSSVHGIFQVIVLEWVVISLSRGSSRPREWTQVSHIAGGFFTVWAIREANTIGIISTYNSEMFIINYFTHVLEALLNFKGSTWEIITSYVHLWWKRS